MTWLKRLTAERFQLPPPGHRVGATAGYPEEAQTATGERLKAGNSGDSYVVAEVDILNGVQQFDALGHRLLERLASSNEAGAARALIDDGGTHRFTQVARPTRRPARIDQVYPPIEAVDHLIAHQINRMIRREFTIHPLVNAPVWVFL